LRGIFSFIESGECEPIPEDAEFINEEKTA